MKQILSLQDCLECKDCCYYYKNYRHLAPAFTRSTRADRTKLIDKKTHFIAKCSRKKNESYFFCDFKEKEKCSLKGERPFGCKLYPFNVMKDKKGNIVLGIDRDCKGIKKKSEKQINKYVEEIIPEIKKKIKMHPFLVEDFQTELEIIKKL